MTPIKLTAKELQLADVVRMDGQNGPFMDFIVKKINNDSVDLWRPYGTTTDFSYTGGVICYIGTEDMNVRLDSSLRFDLMRRTELK